MQLEPHVLALLVGAAFVAGTIDAIAGGGGLITVPALLVAGLPARYVLGTNKGQSVFGSLASLLRFRHAGLIDRRRARWTWPIGLFGATLGALATFLVPNDVLKPLILGLLVAVAAVLALRPKTLVPHGVPPLRPMAVASAIALAIGLYDGFFGPGTGTFLILCFVLWMKDVPQRASADAKVVNFASNLASVIVFATADAIRWDIAVPMAAAQIVGGVLGASMTLRIGDSLVRRAVLAMVVLVAAKLAWDMLR